MLYALAVEMSRGMLVRLSERRDSDENRTYRRMTKTFLLAQEFIRRIQDGWFGENCERFRPVEEEAAEQVLTLESLDGRERAEQYFAGLPIDGEWIQWSRPDNRFWRRPVEEILEDLCQRLDVKSGQAKWLEQEYGLAARLAEVKALAEAAAAEVVAAAPKKVAKPRPKPKPKVAEMTRAEWNARPIYREPIEETWARFREEMTGSRDPPA